MAGASEVHDLIAGDLNAALKGALRGKCHVHTADMRLYIPATGLFTYADAVVVCGPGEFSAGRPPSLMNPSAIFEVLSESTESYDRGKKFEHYRSVASLLDYVLCSQQQVLVEQFTRQPDGTWVLRELRAGQSLHLPCGAILIDDIYLDAGPVQAAAKSV
jgi:Uma2 family endonuclease